ncbi:versatile peroxidase VPL1 [Colletotrichum tamarilloi]|uniref:Peroxidase n=1 Tax=Colletotrichum tamarilloi TaxID=1209934 RepID=A0ABQ9QIN1_9PEZI|nr:versatile peroxidase VPL1 [Colletotrichum tamarilloi]KAI3540422.1 versatile peroxidase VPL1 [Colletotrichum filicis]KAK1471845.1 versatile peroxidase VPL1 [Colletotrichum tamarilloi]
MHASSLLLAGLLALANAAVLPHAEDASSGAVVAKGLDTRGGAKCPAVWKQVNTELNSLFMSGPQCNDLARASIRAIFHDCGSWDTSQGLNGGCDGSLIVGVNPDVELNRSENRGLQKIAGVLQGLATKYNTTVADMIVFAGNAAIFLCPGGPKVKTFIGRADSTTSAKDGGLPDVFASADVLVALFQKKGLDAEALAALLGAHSTSTQNFVDTTKANASQDSTPGKWDVSYYKETYDFATKGTAAPGVFVFPSDSKISTSTSGDIGKKFQGFIGQQNKWSSSFTNAMEKMALFGNDKNNLADCTDSITRL